MAVPDSSFGPVHYMQSSAWAGIKNKFGWKSDVLNFNGKKIIAYKRTVPGVGRLIYVPGFGPLDIADTAKFTALLKDTYMKGAFGVRLELDQPMSESLMRDLTKKGWRAAEKHVQYRHTIHIDLTPDESDIWMGFKSRGRYEVLQAQKANVRVELVEPTDENLQKMYNLMRITSHRNKFFIRDAEFSMAYWRKFRELNQLRLFFATHDGDLLAASVIITNGTAAWNKDGGSTRDKASMMAPRLIQWEAMKMLKREGVKVYDLGGIPNPDNFSGSSIPGIYVFKSGFSKDTTTLMPTLELPLSTRYGVWPKAEKQWLRIYNLLAHNLWW